MSTFPLHEENLKDLQGLGVDVSEYTKDTIESYGYDELVYLVSDLVTEIRSLKSKLDKEGK